MVEWLSFFMLFVGACLLLLTVSYCFFLLGFILRTLLSNKSKEDKMLTYALLIIDFTPFGRLIAWPDANLSWHLRSVMAVLKIDHVHLRRPRILLVKSKILPKIHAVLAYDLILFNEETYRHASQTLRCFIVGHEVGHYLEYHLNRKDYHVMDRLWNDDKELRASAFAWYCIERMCMLDTKNPEHFDWEDFLEKLPFMLLCSPRQLIELGL